jgi:hypothetical protein
MYLDASKADSHRDRRKSTTPKRSTTDGLTGRSIRVSRERIAHRQPKQAASKCARQYTYCTCTGTNSATGMSRRHWRSSIVQTYIPAIFGGMLPTSEKKRRFACRLLLPVPGTSEEMILRYHRRGRDFLKTINLIISNTMKLVIGYTLIIASCGLSSAAVTGGGGGRAANKKGFANKPGKVAASAAHDLHQQNTKGHGMIKDGKPRTPDEKTQFIGHASMSAETLECVHETGSLMRDTELLHATAQLSDQAMNMDLTSGGAHCEGSDEVGHTCTLEFAESGLQDACAEVNGTYLEEAHVVICSLGGGAARHHADKGTSGGRANPKAEQLDAANTANTANTIMFNLVNLPDCLGQSCAGDSVDTSVLTTKNSHRLEAALRTRMAMPEGLPFEHDSERGHWTCHLDLEGTKTHLGSQMHGSFLDAKKQEESLSEEEKKEQLREQLEQKKEQELSLRGSSAFTSTVMGVLFAVTANALLLLVV